MEGKEEGGMSYRILILQGVRDDSTVRREIHVRKVPALREHTFEYVYAAEPPDLDETQPLPARVLQNQQSTLDERRLLACLNETVERFQPDLLLVHSGPVFQSSLDQLWFVLTAVKAGHPRMRIGFQPRPFEQYGPKPFFEYSTELRDIMRAVFGDEVKGKQAVK